MRVIRMVCAIFSLCFCRCSVRDFEYTRESIVFDLLGLQLYHGWLADPQNREEQAAVGQCTYNQLVEKIIEDKSSADEGKLTQGPSFMKRYNALFFEKPAYGISLKL